MREREGGRKRKGGGGEREAHRRIYVLFYLKILKRGRGRYFFHRMDTLHLFGLRKTL